MPQFLFEFGYIIRLLRKNPVQSLACVLMIGLGMAMTLVVFLILNDTQYKLFEFENADRWASVSTVDVETGMSSTVDAISIYTYQRLRSEAGSFEEVAAMASTKEAIFDIASGSTVVGLASVSSNLLRAAGIQAVKGRIFSDEDSSSNRPSTVLLSYPSWQNHFAGRQNIVGETLSLDKVVYTIVGVTPENVDLPFYFDFLLPLPSTTVNEPLSNGDNVTVFGMLREDSDLASASAEVQLLYSGMQQQYPDVFSPEHSLQVKLLRGAIFNSNDFGVVGLLRVFALIIFALACLNVSNLLLARSIERRQEFAIRTALGSARWQIVRQSLQESFLLCAFGTLLGLMCAGYALSVYSQAADAMTIGGSNLMRNESDLSIDSYALFIAGTVALVFWFACSLIPALAFSNSQIDQVLKEGGLEVSNGKKFRTTKMLVGFEIIMSVFLLIICGGLVGSMKSLVNFDYGLETDNRIVSRVRLPDSDYETMSRRLEYLRNLSAQLEASAGVQDVVFVSNLPFEIPFVSFTFDGSNLNSSASAITQFNLGVSDNYFDSFGVRIIEGRGFSSDDRQESQPVVVVDELLASRLWPNQSALGQQIQLSPENNDTSYTVIGIAAHVSQVNSFLNADKVGTFYQPVSQTQASKFSIVSEQTLNLDEYIELANSASSDIDRNVALYDHMKFDQYLEGKSKHFELLAKLFVWMGITAIVLASTGIFSIISRSVLQRIKEMGIRQSLGAQRAHVIRIYLKQGLIYMVMAAIIGGGLGLSTTMLLVTAFTDLLDYFPLVLSMVLLGMGLLVFAASYLPAKKAVAIEPGDALRYE